MGDSLDEMTEDRPETLSPSAESDLGLAVGACDFPIVVWDLPTGILRLANEAAARMLGRPLAGLPGLNAVELTSPRDVVQANVSMMSSGSSEAVHGVREIRAGDGRPIRAKVWSRVLELDHVRVVVTLVVPIDQVPSLGRDPSQPWRELAPIAIGRVDAQWRIRCITVDIERITGRPSKDWVGSSLLDAVYPDDRRSIETAGQESASSVQSLCHIRLSRADGRWLDVCLLLAAGDDDEARFNFAVVGPPDTARSQSERIAELERRLLHIAAEVRAAGVMEEVSWLPSSRDYPQLKDLTTRQWEILSRLLRGERVPAIADHLYVSQSTVRNHLAAIFQKFGAHSQSELLEQLRQPPRLDRPV